MWSFRGWGKIKLEKATNTSVRAYWEKRKTKVVLQMALLFVVLVSIGMEFSAPGVSLTGTLQDRLILHSETLTNIVENFPHYLKAWGVPNVHLEHITKKAIKGFAIIIAFILCVLLIVNKDPFRNVELLRKIHYSGYSKFKPYLREVAFYARFLPSNMLVDICESCPEKEGCARRIEHTSEKKTRIWCDLFPLLSPKDADFWMRNALSCRRVYYLKYGFVVTTFILILLLVAVYIHNLQSSSLKLDQTPLAVYTILIGVVTLYFGYLFRTKWGTGGPWREYKEKAVNFIQSEEFQNFFRKNYCSLFATKEELRSIFALVHQLDYLVEDKLITHCSGTNDRSGQNRANLRRILHHLKALYTALNIGNATFRAAIFLLSDDHKYLYPFVLDELEDSKFTITGEPEKVPEFFGLDGNSVAAQAWNMRTAISRNSDINTVSTVSTSPPKSIYCKPLEFNDKVYAAIRVKFPGLHQRFGVLCIDCDNPDIFSSVTFALNTHLIRPFANRIVYELSLGIYYSAEEAK